MLTTEQKKQFSEILEALGESLDISESQFDAAVRSYKAVGEWLAESDSPLSPYKPEIRPQGSFMLGTMIKPIHDKDDLDIDLVCELFGKRPEWTQFNLKQVVGDRLKSNALYKKLLDVEGRRCWTLVYSETANYHLDILPSIVSTGYSTIFEKAFSSNALSGDLDSLAIRITDKTQNNYYTDTSLENWIKSNPFGYAKWFFNEASIDIRKTIMLSESVQPVPKFQKEKLPLQRVVQILKRHRDMMFNGDEHKPISIIITTLASKAYKKETSIIDALVSISKNMGAYIEERYDWKLGKMIKWIPNPVNPEENFADKWQEHPQRERNFYKWLEQVKIDIQNITQQQGLHLICESMKRPFGEQPVTRAFSVLADNSLNLRQTGNLKMSARTGILGSLGTIITKSHNFHGKDK